jgi:hypothetical protein
MRSIRFLTVLSFFVFTQSLFAQGGGTWTQLKNASPLGPSGTMLLLTDGTVITNPSDITTPISAGWARLTPDSTGSYINGTWTTVASMSTPRFSFPANVLPSGKVLVIGGEYSGIAGNQDFNNTGEIYDPVANSWSPITVFPQSQFGDDPTQLLPNGKVLAGFITGPETYLYSPSTNTWTQTGTKLRNDASDEETWCLLPDGSVLSYDIFASPDTGPGSAQRYIPSKGQWVDAGVVPVPLTGNALGYELGPMTLLPDGRVFLVGANQNTVLYSPATNTWAAGPKLPANMGADDAPGAMLPNGRFIFGADFSSPNLFTPPTKLFEFDFKTNTLADVTPGGNLGNELATGQGGAGSSLMLVLPNGHLLMTNGAGTVWDYAPNGSPNSAWAPTITSISKGVGASANIYTLSGTQLTGISEGASFGDDAEMSTNYPIVRLTDSGKKVHFARTFNWTPGVATGTVSTTTQFTLPANLANGTYQLSVIANGIASTPVNFVFPFVNPPPNYNFVTTSYNAMTKTLTITGDSGPNAIAITERGKQLTIEGAGLTRIGTVGSNAQQVSYNLSGDLIIHCQFAQSATPPTSDSITLVSVASSNTSVVFGSGADSLNLTYCTVGTLTVDGGTNPAGSPDTVTYVGSHITVKNVSNVP